MGPQSVVCQKLHQGQVVPCLLVSSSPCSPCFLLSLGFPALEPISPCSLGPGLPQPSWTGSVMLTCLERPPVAQSNVNRTGLQPRYGPRIGEGTPCIQDVGSRQSSQCHQGAGGELCPPTCHSSPYLQAVERARAAPHSRSMDSLCGAPWAGQ